MPNVTHARTLTQNQQSLLMYTKSCFRRGREEEEEGEEGEEGEEAGAGNKRRPNRNRKRCGKTNRNHA